MEIWHIDWPAEGVDNEQERSIVQIFYFKNEWHFSNSQPLTEIHLKYSVDWNRLILIHFHALFRGLR